MSRSTITITSDLAEAIAARLADAPREADGPPGPGALPLYADADGVVGIRPDGAILGWLPDGGEARPVEDRARMLIALVAGARRYPELRGLLPARGPGAIDCRCREIPECVSGLFWCGQCGGIGWVAEGKPVAAGRLEWPRRRPTFAEVGAAWILRAIGSFLVRHLIPRIYSPLVLLLVALALGSFYGAFVMLGGTSWRYAWNRLGLVLLGILSLMYATRGAGRPRPRRRPARGPIFDADDPEVADLPPTSMTQISERLRQAREARKREDD